MYPFHDRSFWLRNVCNEVLHYRVLVDTNLNFVSWCSRQNVVTGKFFDECSVNIQASEPLAYLKKGYNKIEVLIQTAS